MSFITDAMARARAKPRRVVLPEGDEPRIVEAAVRIAGDGIATPVLFGTGPAPAGVAVLDPAGLDPEPLTAAILANRPNMRPELAARMVKKPLIAAAAMVAAGEADALIAGAASPTRRVIEAAGLAIGMREGLSTPSSFFAMLIEGREPLFFADCALNVSPTAPELAEIALATAASAEALTGAPPACAFLSFSTHGSGSGDSVALVRHAVDIAQSRHPGWRFDGPLQADAALSATIAEKKGVSGAVAGAANVLIFPDLDAGNIGYKLVQELAGAQAVGPFLQGFAKPVCDLSRGARADDIVAAAAVTLAMAAPVTPAPAPSA